MFYNQLALANWNTQINCSQATWARFGIAANFSCN